MWLKDLKVTEKILNKSEKTENGEVFENPSTLISGAFGTYSRIYPFSNDNLLDMSSVIKTPGRVFTVAASGDHALWSVLKGATEVRTFDINVLSYYYQEIKIAAVRALSYEEFLEFFGLNGEGLPIVKNDELFMKVLEKIKKPNVLMYWKCVYDLNVFTLENKSNLFSPLYSTRQNEYLTRGNYYILKTKLLDIDKITFKYMNIYQINKKKVSGLADTILLSNILEYYEGDYYNFVSFMDRLSKVISDNGIIQLTHDCKQPVYDYYLDKDADETNINLLDSVAKLHSDKYFVVETINSSTGYLKK